MLILILIEIALTQALRLDKYPFTIYPMYTNKFDQSRSMVLHTFCSDELPKKFIPARALMPIYSRPLVGAFYRWKRSNNEQSIYLLKKTIAENAKDFDLHFSPESIYFDAVHFNLIEYKNFLLDPENYPFKKKRSCRKSETLNAKY